MYCTILQIPRTRCFLDVDMLDADRSIHPSTRLSGANPCVIRCSGDVVQRDHPDPSHLSHPHITSRGPTLPALRSPTLLSAERYKSASTRQAPRQAHKRSCTAVPRRVRSKRRRSQSSLARCLHCRASGCLTSQHIYCKLPSLTPLPPLPFLFLHLAAPNLSHPSLAAH